jgi:hypothetical protein
MQKDLNSYYEDHPVDRFENGRVVDDYEVIIGKLDNNRGLIGFIKTANWDLNVKTNSFIYTITEDPEEALHVRTAASKVLYHGLHYISDISHHVHYPVKSKD